MNSPRLWEIFNLPQIEDAYIEKMKRRNAAYEEIRDMGAYMACFGNGVVLFPAQDDETGETYDYIWRYNQGRVKRHFPDRSSGLIFPFHLGNDPG